MGGDVVISVVLEAESAERPKTVIDVIGRSFSIVRLQADLAWEAKSDVVISPKVREFAWDDFLKTPQLVAAGEQAAIEALPRIEEALRRARERLAAPGWEAKHVERRHANLSGQIEGLGSEKNSNE
jgi:predicted acylesterase/phospholipase RssA